MPTYEYECDACKRAFEFEQKISDTPLQRCPLPDPRTAEREKYQPQIPEPSCNGPVRRLISGSTSFVLKGTGWFKDGY